MLCSSPPPAHKLLEKKETRKDKLQSMAQCQKKQQNLQKRPQAEAAVWQPSSQLGKRKKVAPY